MEVSGCDYDVEELKELMRGLALKSSPSSSSNRKLKCSGNGAGQTKRKPQSIRQDVPNVKMGRKVLVDVVLLRRVLERVKKWMPIILSLSLVSPRSFSKSEQKLTR